jgi:hypothetical protein
MTPNTYKVAVTRVTDQTRNFFVVADSVDEALEKAKEAAANFDWHNAPAAKDVEYQAEVTE